METICYGYGLVEGPRVDVDGSLYFSDLRGGGVFRRAPDGTIRTVVPGRKAVGGIALHAQGGLVLSGRNVCHVRDGLTRVLFERPDIPGFNDLIPDAAGRIYVGSLGFRAGGGTRPKPLPPGELWRVDGEGQASALYGDVQVSNGLGFSPDGGRLYHGDSIAGRIFVADVAADGRLENRRVFADLSPLGPGGLAVDEAGRVWVAVFRGGCIARYLADGTEDRRIPVAATTVTSLAFGGADRRDLYVVTADNTERPERRGTVFRMRVEVPGLPVPPARV